MAVTAAMVKELREMTGAGMMECKKALVETDGDMEAAVDVLRKSGAAKAVKKAGRATDEGTIMAVVSDDAKKGTVLELKCETDFVGMNEKFKGYAERIAKVALANDESDVEALKAETEGDVAVKDIIADCIHVMGENTQLTRVKTISADAVASYIHLGGKIGVLVTFAVEGIEPTDAKLQECGRNVAMQVAALNPIAATRADVPADVVEHEKSIYIAQAAESGKPEKIQEKIAEGRMEKFYKESTLTEQEYVRDSDVTVNQYVQSVAKELGGKIEVTGFVRFALND